MSGIGVSSNALGTTGELKVLGGLWLAGAAATAVPAFMLGAVSDHAGDRLPGLVLGAMTLVGVALGGWLVAAPRLAALRVSFGASVLWLVGAAVVSPTQDFTADVVWASGVPALVALATAATAWWVHRAERRAATF